MIALSILPYWVKSGLLTIISVLSTVMFISALASWIPQVRQSKVGYYLFLVTEPIVYPMRKLLRRIPALRTFPLDLSFLATYFALMIIRQLIYII